MPLHRLKTSPKPEPVATAVRENSLEDFNSLLGVGGGFNTGWGDAVRQPWTMAWNSPATLLTLDWVLLSEAYKGQGLIQTIIDQPVEDALRGGFDIISDELDDDQKAEILLDIGALEAAEEKNDLPVGPMKGSLVVSGVDMGESDLQSVKDVRKWSRLFGGAGLIINTDQDFSQPLDVEAIGPDTPLQFIAADRWEMILTMLQLYDPSVPCPYNYYGLPLNRTRVIRSMGIRAPAFVRRQLQGWGLSEMERCLSAINSYDRMESLVFDLLKEAKVDVMRVAGFNDQLATDQGMALIMRRLQIAMQGKSYNAGLIMDMMDEFDQKQIAFGGIADIWEQIRSNLCAAVRFPENKLFGRSATGFGGGEDALENYNGIVEIERQCLRPLLKEVVRLRAKQKFGILPKVDFQFKPLKILNGVENETVKTSEQNRVLALNTADLLDGQEASEMLKGMGLLPVDSAVLKGEREQEPMGETAFNDDPNAGKTGPDGKPAAGSGKRGLAAASPATRAAVSSRGDAGKASGQKKK